MLMYIMSSTSNALWHPMQYVGLIMMAVAVIGLLCSGGSKKKDD
jgi:hypothetical protein